MIISHCSGSGLADCQSLRTRITNLLNSSERNLKSKEHSHLCFTSFIIRLKNQPIALYSQMIFLWIYCKLLFIWNWFQRELTCYTFYFWIGSAVCSRAAWCKYMGCVISNEWRQWSERMYSAVNSRILQKDMVYIHFGTDNIWNIQSVLYAVDSRPSKYSAVLDPVSVLPPADAKCCTECSFTTMSWSVLLLSITWLLRNEDADAFVH